MNRYVKGRRYEYKTRDYLLGRGAVYVIRSAGSHGFFDLVAIFRNEVWLVQVKVSKNRPARHALTKKLPWSVGYILAWWRPGATTPILERIQ